MHWRNFFALLLIIALFTYIDYQMVDLHEGLHKTNSFNNGCLEGITTNTILYGSYTCTKRSEYYNHEMMVREEDNDLMIDSIQYPLSALVLTVQISSSIIIFLMYSSLEEEPKKEKKEKSYYEE